MRHRKPFFLSVIAAAVAALAMPITALAADTYMDTVGGVEIAATPTKGTFTGTANGDLPGTWLATVVHNRLTGAVPAAITGGSFSLATTLDESGTLITGDFVGGTVRQTTVLTGCSNETYAVNGNLGNVGPPGANTGTGRFVATLTHYRVRLFTRCLTYSASIAGTINLTF